MHLYFLTTLKAEDASSQRDPEWLTAPGDVSRVLKAGKQFLRIEILLPLLGGFHSPFCL
jgi:hypothetical protein